MALSFGRPFKIIGRECSRSELTETRNFGITLGQGSGGTGGSLGGTLRNEAGAAIDFDNTNGDGRSDILWRDTAGDTVEWLMANGAPTQGIDLGNSAGWSVAGVGDFNGDGRRTFCGATR